MLKNRRRSDLRVLIISSSYLPQKGGLQRVVSRLAEGLIERDVPVCVIANKFPIRLALHEIIAGVPVWRFPFFAPDIADFKQGRPGLYFVCFFTFVWTLAGFMLTMLFFRPTVVNIHFPLNQSPFYNAIHSLFPGVKVVVSLHGNDIEQYLSDPSQYDQDVRQQTYRSLLKLLRYADAVSAPSDYLFEKARQLSSDVSENFHLIPNGIDLESSQTVHPPHPEQFILGVGRLTYRKGFDLLISAFIYIADSFPGLDLMLLGEGEMREDMEEMIAEAGLQDRILLAGWVLPAEVFDLMRASLFVVVPSRQEGFGMTALEAMAAGKAVVATKEGALPELLADQSNPLVASTAEGLAQGMVDLLRNPQLREVIAQRNKKRAADYSWQTVIDQYINVYQSLMVDVEDVHVG